MNKTKSLQQKLIILVLLLLTIYSFHFFFKIGISNADDFNCYIDSQNGHYLAHAEIWAKGQGRFFFYYRTFMAFFPYIFNNFIITKIIQYLPVFFSFIVASLWMKELFSSNKIGYLTYLFLIIFLSVPTAKYQPPTAYPFLFTVDVFLFLLSFYLMTLHFKTNNYRYYLLSIFCFFVPFYCFEAYIILYIPYMIIIFIKSNPELKISHFLKKKSLKKTLPPLILMIFFYIIYFTFRFLYTSNYDGNTLVTNLNYNKLFKFIYSINKSAIPTYIFFNNPIIGNTSIGIRNLNFILLHSTITSDFFAIIVSFLCIYLLSKSSFSKVKPKLFIMLTILLLYIPCALNVILGITKKYNNPNIYLNGYVTTYFAYFGITLSILLITSLIWKILIKYNKIFSYIFLFFLFISIFFTSLYINYSNRIISNDLSLSRDRILLIDNSFEKNIYKTIPEKSVIIAPQFYDSKSIIIQNRFSNLISKYIITTKLKKTLYFVKSKKQANILKHDGNIYLLKFENNIDKFSFSKIEHSN